MKTHRFVLWSLFHGIDSGSMKLEAVRCFALVTLLALLLPLAVKAQGSGSARGSGSAECKHNDLINF